MPPKTASIGNVVWKDLNGNGLQERDEPGVADVEVTLWTDDDNNGTADTLVMSTLTGFDGSYAFTELDPSKIYMVQFHKMPTMPYTAPNQGDDDSMDSDVDPNTGFTTPIIVSGGENSDTIDGGMLDLPSSLGDIVWKDLNENGIQDIGELGVENVTVTLWTDDNGDGAPDSMLSSVQTDAKGNYLFENLNPHLTYIIQVTVPEDCELTLHDQGENDAQDSDIDPMTGLSGAITLQPNSANTSVDVGLKPLTSSIGNVVWKDTNENGLQDDGEKGVPFVTVNLWTDDDANGTPDSKVNTTQTTPLGQYLFTSLDPSKVYIVQVELPSDCNFTTANQGDNDTLDSDVDPNTALSNPITLNPGESNTTIDVGLTPKGAVASIGNLVWLDENANGIQDEGEEGVAGVNVVLLTAGGQEVATMLTDEDGFYTFGGLTPGLYTVKVERPSDAYIFTKQDQLDEFADSDADPTTGQTIVTELIVDENDLTWDVGLVAPPILTIDKRASSEVIQQGEVIRFNIIYRNDGFGDASGVVITELVPQRTTFLSNLSTPGWVCENGNTSAGSVCTFALGDVPAQSGNTGELVFAVQVDLVLETTVTSLMNQIQIRDDGLHPSGISGQSVDEVRVVVRHPTPLNTVDENNVTTSQSYIYLPIVRRNLFKERPTSLLTLDEWTAVWACAVSAHPEYVFEPSVLTWANAVCSQLTE